MFNGEDDSSSESDSNDDMIRPVTLQINIISSDDDNSQDAEQEATNMVFQRRPYNDPNNDNSMVNTNREESTSETTNPNKRKRPSEPEPNDDDDDGMTCPICLDGWSAVGEHRLCSLRCGHLFGFHCLNRWLVEGKRACPTCKKRVNKNDIRYIYARKVIAVDNPENEILREKLNDITEKYRLSQQIIIEHKNRENTLLEEISQLRSNLLRLSQVSEHNSSHFVNNQLPKLTLEKSMKICKRQFSRVFDINTNSKVLFASMKSPSNLFDGYGLKSIDLNQFKSTSFVSLHSSQIRDIAFNPKTNTILTASMDKHFKIYDCTSKVITHQCLHAVPLWCCCWDIANDYILYVGTQSGIILKYDTRRIIYPLATLFIPNDTTPVVSVQCIPPMNINILPNGGLLSCKLNALSLYENHGNYYTRHHQSVEGPFFSMTYHSQRQQLLISSRPNSRICYSRHYLCTLAKRSSGYIDSNVLHSFQGGSMQKLLTRSCFISHTNDYIAAHQESTKSIDIWNINSGEKAYSIPSKTTVLDIKGLHLNDSTYMITLGDTFLDFYKFS